MRLQIGRSFHVCKERVFLLPCGLSFGTSFRSGTEEEYTERTQLLDDICQLFDDRDAEKYVRDKAKKKEEADRARAALLRDDALRTLSAKVTAQKRKSDDDPAAAHTAAMRLARAQVLAESNDPLDDMYDPFREPETRSPAKEREAPKATVNARRRINTTEVIEQRNKQRERELDLRAEELLLRKQELQLQKEKQDS